MESLWGPKHTQFGGEVSLRKRRPTYEINNKYESAYLDGEITGFTKFFKLRNTFASRTWHFSIQLLH